MWAMLGKQLLKSGAKKIAKDKILNRKKKTPKRTSGKEVSEGLMNNEEQKKSGALAVRPTTGLVPTAGDFAPVSTTVGESDIVIIKKQVIQVRDILKDTRTAQQAERVNQRKARQTDKRKEREDKIEKPKVEPKAKKSGIKMPNLGLGIGNFLTWLIAGLIFNKLKDLLPALKKIFKVLKPIANFIGGVLQKTLGFVVGFIDLSYAGVEKLREGIVAIGGEGAGELFDKFGKLFTQVMNGALIAALVAAAVSRRNRFRGPDKRPKGKIRKAVERWFKKTKVGKFIRNQKAGLLRQVRRFSKTGVGRTLNALRPKNVNKFIMEGGIDRTLKSGIKRFTPGFLKKGSGFRTAISTGIEKSVKVVQDLPKNTLDAVKKIKWSELPLVKETKGVFNGITGSMSNWMDEIGKNLDPGRMINGLMDTARPTIDAFLEKNPALKKLSGKIKPAEFVPWVSKNLKGWGKKALPIANAVKNNKALRSMSNFLGPIDLVVDSMFALVDYSLGGENLINAVVKALSSTLGFAAGAAAGAAITGTATFFTAGAGAPLIPFVTFGMGMAGSLIGDQIGKLILNRLAGIEGLANMDDPIAEKMGLSPRKIIRDPYGEKENDRDITGQDRPRETIVSSNGSTNVAEGLNGKTSYGSDGVVAVENTTTYIQPVEV